MRRSNQIHNKNYASQYINKLYIKKEFKIITLQNEKLDTTKIKIKNLIYLMTRFSCSCNSKQRTGHNILGVLNPFSNFLTIRYMI